MQPTSNLLNMQSKLLLLFLASLYISLFLLRVKRERNRQSFQYNKIQGKQSLCKKETDKILKVSTEVYYKSREINYIDGQIDALSYMTEIYTNTGNTKWLWQKPMKV